MNFDPSQGSYRAFRDIVAERTSSLIAWVGSGLSVEAGLPTWPGLKQGLLDALLDKCNTLEQEDRDKLYPQYISIRDERDFWISFQRLKSVLGGASYRATIRQCLAPAASAQAPAAYGHLWRLHLKGVVNLNLDRLATKAYMDRDNPVSPAEFTGKVAGRYSHVLKSPYPFILNIHGVHEDESSWVLTKEELDTLVVQPGCREFLSACLLSNTVVFIGLSLDDRAIRSYVSELRKAEIDWGEHFWITSRGDLATDRWAEELGIRVIRYDAQGGDHTALDELFADLCAYVPTETPAEPVITSAEVEARTMPEPDELLRMGAEEIRQILNARAQQILCKESEQCYLEFEEFCEEYDEAISERGSLVQKRGRTNSWDMC